MSSNGTGTWNKLAAKLPRRSPVRFARLNMDYGFGIANGDPRRLAAPFGPCQRTRIGVRLDCNQLPNHLLIGESRPCEVPDDPDVTPRVPATHLGCGEVILPGVFDPSELTT